MLSTNLLPKEDRENIKLECWYRAVLFFVESLSIILIIGSILLLPSFLPIVFQQKEADRLTALDEQNSQKIGVADNSNEIKLIKKNLLTVWNFVDSPPKASSVLDVFLNIDNSMPGVILTSLNIDNTGKVTINGLAQTREDLLNFVSNLQETGKFDDIHTPLSALVRGAESFSIQTKLKPALIFNNETTPEK